MRWLQLIKIMPRIAEAMEQMQVKGWYLSKTIWSNLIVLSGAVIYALHGNDVLIITDAEAAALSVAAVAAANIVLRVLTSKPVGMRSVPGAIGRESDSAEERRDSLGV